MMLHLNRLEVGKAKHQMSELTFKNAIKISKINQKMNEHRISAFLQYCLSDDSVAYAATVQERYFLLIQYLSAQKKTFLESDTTFANYLLPGTKEWITQIESGLLTVQQLSGRHAELLEEVCEDAADWIIGSMAMQIVSSDLKDLPPLPQADSGKPELIEVLTQRVEVLGKLPQSVFDGYYNLVSEANEQMASLVRLGFDKDGITVLGGTDDAPMRFRPSASFTGIAATLERYYAQQSTGSSE